MTRWFTPAACLLACLLAWTPIGPDLARAFEGRPSDDHRSPVDLALDPAGAWLATANQTSSSVSLVRLGDGKVLDELAVGPHPQAIAVTPDGHHLLVSCRDSGELVFLRVGDRRLQQETRLEVGFHPHGIAVSGDGKKAYVALTAADQVAEVDLASRQVTARIDVGRWPRNLALSPDGQRLTVGTSGDRGITMVDTARREQLFVQSFVGLNIGQMQATRDGRYVYFPWIVYRRNPITVGNIRLGWVLASRLARIRLDRETRREAISLDPPGEAVGDPHGLALTSDEQQVVISASGSQELLVLQIPGLPFQDFGSTDHIDPRLRSDSERFYRIPLGGRPMAVRMAPDDRTVYIANYLDNAVQVVDFKERRVTQTWPLGGPAEPDLVRRGEAIFYDAKRSLDQWYSCHSCHFEGGSNAVQIDTLNDGSVLTFKTVLPLYHLGETAPWTWHGWQTDLSDAMRKSITSTMQGPAPSDEDVAALIAYLKTRKAPPNPFRRPDGTLTELAAQGEQVFRSEQAGCATCHAGPYFTDGQIHDVGLGGRNDRYAGFNTPSLIGVYQKVRLLHDGRASSLRDLLTGPHSPARVSGAKELSEQQLDALIEYLKSL